MASLNIPIAFLAGILSFLSPCVLPLVPGFLSFLSGVSGGQVKAAGANSKAGAVAPHDRLRLFINSVFFVLGFTVAFAVIGLLLSGLLAKASFDIRLWLERIGGLVIISFGLFVLGILKLPFLEQEYKLKPTQTRWQYLTSAIFGVSFAVGWSPCVGAVLGSIITLAATDAGGALLPMVAYSIGLAIPFLIMGALGSEALGLLTRFKGFMRYFNIATGLLLILVGLLVMTGQLVRIANLVTPQSLLPYLNGGGI